MWNLGAKEIIFDSFVGEASLVILSPLGLTLSGVLFRSLYKKGERESYNRNLLIVSMVSIWI